MPAGDNEVYGIPNLEEGFAKTIKYTIEFCKKNKMKMIFAWKRDKKREGEAVLGEAVREELNFYKKYFTNIEINYLLSNSLEEEEKDRFTPYRNNNYKVMFQSQVVVATYSTMLREYLGTGGKVLSCNMTSSDIFDFPIKGICSIKDCTFEEFEKKLLNIFSISQEEYFEKLGKDKNYLMEYDKEISTIEIIRKKIDSLL